MQATITFRNAAEGNLLPHREASSVLKISAALLFWGSGLFADGTLIRRP